MCDWCKCMGGEWYPIRIKYNKRNQLFSNKLKTQLCEDCARKYFQAPKIGCPYIPVTETMYKIDEEKETSYSNKDLLKYYGTCFSCVYSHSGTGQSGFWGCEFDDSIRRPFTECSIIKEKSNE